MNGDQLLHSYWRHHEWQLTPVGIRLHEFAANDGFPPDLRVSPASYRPVPECRLIQIAADATLHRRMSAVRPMGLRWCEFRCAENEWRLSPNFCSRNAAPPHVGFPPKLS
ncbi:hypothetical protein CUV01_18665 (plasmid) [Paracoccus tegillarcae]|uniref:Uncharacterized protein n=1 Tax=Paracoccus tegillarcae TaxID=1529068 RepID=A0A2K9EUZ6_9RHOB|nr:hypothetical protein CUV01_18665 [Paracoccus tegillarcae]